MNIANWLYSSARAYPKAPAVLFGDQLHASYGDLAARSAALARIFATEHGVTPGDRIAVFTANCPEYLELLYAIWFAGAVAVPINYKLHPREAAWILDNAEARLVFTSTGTDLMQVDLPPQCLEIGIESAEYSKLLDGSGAGQASLRPPITRSSEDVAWLFYTSGTTGRPKGVMLTHANLAIMSLTYALDVDPVSAHDHPLYAAPMSHGAGLYNFPYVRVAACHIIPRSRGFDPLEIIQLAGSQGNLRFFAAPTMIRRLVDVSAAHGFRGEGIGAIIYGGGPMYAADLDTALALFGDRLVQIYGQGESPMTITVLPRNIVSDQTHPNWRARRKSVGIAQASVNVRVVNASLEDVQSGETGEIVVSGGTVMKGYWRNEEATEKTLVNGWLRTGDLGFLDADGFLTLTDRAKDVIISGGTNIYPREVEEVLLQHPSVVEVSVVGAPDREWGEAVVAFIVRRNDHPCDAVELEAWSKSQIASFKKPKRYEFVDELPKNSYGKVVKTVLRDMACTDGRDRS
jgi:acyl-CoA synthetase (AMP-forming)/AMP-acid ligase II